MMTFIRTSTCADAAKRAALTLAGLLSALPGWSQVVDHLPKPTATARQSALNPAPMAMGNPQHRGRMSADILTGVTNGNVLASQLPYARIAGPSGSVKADFWPFPQPTRGATFTHDGTYYNVASTFGQALNPSAQPDDQGPNVVFPLAGGTPITDPPPPSLPTTGVVGFAPGWVAQNGPSTAASGNGYHSAPARSTATTTFAWYPRVQGLSGDYRNFGIRVFLPTPDPAGAEARIGDARYRVTYHMPIGPGRFMLKQKTITLSQEAGGAFWLNDGSENYFPMMTEASYTGATTRTGGAPTLVNEAGAGIALGSAQARARVELVNQTDSPQPNEVVIADQVTFRQDPMAIQSAPTVVGPHGGRKVDPTVPLPAGVPIQQPAAGNNYATNPYAVPDPPLGRIAHPNDSFDFANNPRDPAFVPLTGDRANPSVLYQGPTSLIDPLDAAGISVPPTNAVNHQAYRNGLGQQIPFFSHAQVIIVRRERIHNPENGTTNSNKDGARTVIGTAIYCVDWATRTVIWRFPDRTHLPENAQFNGSAIPNAGLRNPTIGKTEHDSPLDDNNRVSQIPNVVAYDGGSAGTPDGAIQDEEVYLAGDSFASATVVPGISVFGTALVPAYDATNTNMSGVTEAAPDRYSKPGAVTREAIQMPVAFVALGNGTLLALDPFGNNDNRYFENAADTTQLGKFRNGTTNVLWVFAPNSHPRVRTGNFAETVAQYNRRLKTEVPVPGSYFTSAPTVAWARADDDTALDTTAQEPRLFVGNQNGALYALDARALAAGVDSTGKPLPIPFRKGEQIQNPTDAYKATTYDPGYVATAAAHRLELKWWFRASLRGGGIASTPAVSAWPHPRAGGGGSKGVYVTTLEGRVFCLDWDGPVRRSDHETPMVWDGSAGDPIAAVPLPNAAAAFNDDYFSHHFLPTNATLAPEDVEGTVRPRWAFPNTYQNTQTAELARTADPDFSAAFPGTRLLREQALYQGITSSPTLMDFPYIDPDDSRLSGIRRYVVVAANDAVTGLGKLLLLDQIGDRRDFLSNPTPDRAVGVTTPFLTAVPAVGAQVYGQPLDQFVSPMDNGAFTRATPAWTYRTVYDHYDAANAPIISRRNEPSTAASVGGAAKPARRTVPTIYVGGVGRLYAIDLDESTGLLLRWRDSGATQPQALSSSVTVPGPYWTGNVADAGLRDLLNPADSTNPVNPILRVGGKNNYAFNRIMARTVPVQDGTDVESLVVTGGPMQNRNNDTAKLAADALPTNPPTPTVGPAVDATHPSVPLLPGDDPVILKPVLDNITSFAYNMGGAPPVLPTVDLTGRYGNQDIDDPLSTTRGAFPVPAPLANEPNVAYQYPSLWITTAGELETQNALYQVNSNIEGEDTTPTIGGTMGWALVDGDIGAFNSAHVFLASAGGAGGPYSGVTTFTNAYYESFDSSFTARRSLLGAKAAPDTTLDYPNYPDFEPNADTSIFADGPRPHFKPRPLFEGNASALPTALLADDHTGQSGLPLDLNGLFYDKSYATSLAGTTSLPPLPPALATYHNEQGKFRLPAYSGIGSRFTTLVPEVTLTMAGHVSGTPVSDDERRAHFANPANANSDDYSNVNPAGHRVTWIYAGGSEGILHEITPVFSEALGGTGNNFGGPPPVVGLTSEIPNAKIDVFSEADFNALRAAALAGNPIRPDRDGLTVADGGVTQNFRSRAANGLKNVFEWGQKVFIVVWDVPVTARSYVSDPLSGAPLPPTPVPSNFQIRINANGQPIANNWPLVTSGGVVATYPYNPEYSVPSRPLEPGYHRARLGVAFFEWDVQNREPGRALRLTVGQASPVVQGNPPELAIVTSTGNGFSPLGQRNSLEPDVYVANPLGVAAHLVATRDGNVVAAADRSNPAAAPANSIGPFRTENGTGVASNRTADEGAADGSRDPDRDLFDYSQALANGNTIVRRDLRRYTSLGVLNPNYNAILKDANGANDPAFYVPVAAGTGYLGHGRTGSTDLSAAQRNLRLANRSMLPTLPNVRAEVLHDVSWRWWPGNIPNADGGTGNPRKTPAGMGDDGRINPLPWESRPTADSALAPWKDNNQATDVAAASSPDYSDIEATNRTQSAVSLIFGGQDLLRGSGELPNGQFTVTPNPAGLVNPIAAPNLVAPYAATLSVTVPRFQPANLVAMHSLTSAYVPAAPEEFSSAGSTGPLQLPRVQAGDPYPRPLRDGLTNNPTIAPYGYTTQVRIFVDSNGDGRWTAGEAFRVVEVWSGVAVDLGLESGQSDNAPALVDLGRLPAGFGMQNGLLGYGQGSPYQQSGFLPTPLSNAYGNFFKPFTVKNVGNVNLWNLRASQKVQAPFAPPGTFGTNDYFYYFGMKSRNVEGRFGVLAVGADPLASLVQPNVMPQIVTSLDPSFDGAWDSLLQASLPAAIYNRDYAPFQGRHMLKKAVPGSANGTALGLPDVPRDPLISIPSSVPQVSVTVPVGTPAGVYESSASNVNGAPPMLSVFEDHDTNADPDGTNPGYRAVPLMVGNNILRAGPTYGGINTLPPAGPVPPSLAGGAISQGNLRVKNTLRNGAGTIQRIVYLPHTSPAVDLRLTVAETPLTGLVPDWSIASPVAGRTGLFSGLVPGFDPYPLSETSSFLTPGARASSSIQPTAYRGPDGALHVYFARSLAPGANPDARGLQLYHSHLTWNAALGAWQSASPGAPVNDPTASAGQWFSSPTLLTTGAGQETNSAPFVLNTSPASTRSTLFWINSRPTGGGSSVDTLAYSALDANGNPVGALPFVANPDPSLRRFGVRAFFEPTNQTTVALYYGGPAGRWGLYYVPRGADAQGVPVGAAPDAASERNVERRLAIPSGLVSASEPSAVVRRLAAVNNGNTPVVDVYYTGVLRASNTPDLYMTRYSLTGTGRNARMNPLTLPVIQNETLKRLGRDVAYRSQHIQWNRDLGQPAFLPAIAINGVPVTVAANWQWDAASQMLFQNIARPTGVLQVLVDTSVGVVRFRGAGIPVGNQAVTATYQPQTYRLTPDEAPDTGSIAVFDNRTLLASNPALEIDTILRRPAGNVPAGRSWLIWQKDKTGQNATSLFYSVRRVGIDLKSVGALGQNETLELGPRDGNGNSPVAGVSVTIGVTPVPFDVDVKRGKIFVDPIYEGLPALVTFVAHNEGPPVASTPRSLTYTLSPVEESVPTTKLLAGTALDLAQAQNEGQAFAFLDLFQPLGVTRTIPAPAEDPTLQAGRMWMFWSSPRARTGLFPFGPNNLQALPRGYDLFYQTLAPNFESLAL